MHIEPSDGHRPSNSILVAVITLIMAIWAVNYLAVKFALRFLQPLTLASFRVVAASAFMLVIYPIAARLRAFSADLKAHKQPAPGKMQRFSRSTLIEEAFLCPIRATMRPTVPAGPSM